MKTYMSQLITLIVIAIILCSGCSEKKTSTLEISINITQPLKNAEVGHTEIVKGKVTDSNAQVYVLIHPMLTKLWWVQNPPGAINSNGAWQTLCYFGESNKGIGEYFEVVSVVSSKKLKAGKTLQGLPSNVVHSDIITVQRTH